MFPDKNRVMKLANVLSAVFALAPVIYILIVAILLGRGWASRNLDIFPLFIAFLIISAAITAVMVRFQTNKDTAIRGVEYNQARRPLIVLIIGGMQSLSLAIIGLTLSLP